MRGWQALWIVGGLATTAGNVAAQVEPIELDTVRVEVASRGIRTLGAAARSVEVLDRSKLEGLPALNVAEALRWATGVDLMPRSPALTDIGIRGSSFEQVLVLVDGVRVRDSQTGHFNLDLDIPLTAIERIEVLRGSASALYGSDALAGVINIITRDASAAGTQVAIGAGTFERLTASADTRGSAGEATYGLAASFDRSNGHRPGTDFEALVLHGKTALPLGPRNVQLAMGHARRDFGADGFYGAYPSFESTRTTTASLSTALDARPSLSISPSLRLRRHTDDFVLYRDEPERYRNQHETIQVGGELIAQYQISEQFSAAAGLHGYRDQLTSEALGAREEEFLAASMEAAYSSRSASATLGGRLDRLPTGETRLNPSLSASAWLLPQLRLHASGASAFRAPTWTERYYRDPVNIGSPDLAPEQAWTAEAGLEAHPAPTVRLRGTAWIREASDLIDWARPMDQPGVAWMTRNVDQARFTGIETSIRWDLLPRTGVEAGAELISLDENSAEGWDSKYALRPETEVLSLSMDHRWGPVAVSAIASRRRRTDEAAYTLLDGRVSGDLGRILLRLDLNNLLDTEYLDISRLRAAGRSLHLGAEVKLN